MTPANPSSWKQLIRAFAADVKFSSPANESVLAAVERQLRLVFPPRLREILLESDGVAADYGSNVLWSVSAILLKNLEFRESESFRELYMPFDHLLFFGDDGGGDQFAYAIQADGTIHNQDIFRWEHKTDARSWFAGHLMQYFERRLSF